MLTDWLAVMTGIRFTSFIMMYCLLEVCQSLGTNGTIATTFAGLQDDYNLGHIGYIHVQSDTKIPDLELSNCQYYDVNQTTCNFVAELPKSESNVMVLRAWTALTLRDNILVLLGYLMHQSTSDAFTQNIYSALHLLYEEIRRNNIKSMDLLPRMKTIAKTSQVKQVLSLFKSLHNVLPPFCHSAVDELGKYFSKRKDLLRNILRAQRRIDLFTDIGLQMVPMLRLKNTKKNYDRDMEASMGKEFAIFFAAIQEGRIVLTQPVLAVFMLNMKFTELSPIETENFRFLCDVLRLNKIPNWSPGFSGSCCGNFDDPYDMVQAMMKIIVERTKADSVIKTTVTKLLPRLAKVGTSDLASQRMNLFFGHSNFNISLFLEALADAVKIPEVNDFRQIVNNGSINLAYALKGFIRYFYDSPLMIVLAFMERIRYRVPMNSEAKFIIDAILMHLRERYQLLLKLNQTTNTAVRPSTNILYPPNGKEGA